MSTELWKYNELDKLGSAAEFIELLALTAAIVDWKEGRRLLVPSSAFPNEQLVIEGGISFAIEGVAGHILIQWEVQEKDQATISVSGEVGRVVTE